METQSQDLTLKRIEILLEISIVIGMVNATCEIWIVKGIYIHLSLHRVTFLAASLIALYRNSLGQRSIKTDFF